MTYDVEKALAAHRKDTGNPELAKGDLAVTPAEYAALRQRVAVLEERGRDVTSYIRISAKMEGPERIGVNHGAGLRRAIYELDDALATTEGE